MCIVSYLSKRLGNKVTYTTVEGQKEVISVFLENNEPKTIESLNPYKFNVLVETTITI